MFHFFFNFEHFEIVGAPLVDTSECHLHTWQSFELLRQALSSFSKPFFFENFRNVRKCSLFENRVLMDNSCQRNSQKTLGTFLDRS